MPIVEANGIDINYLLSGPESGDLLVLINGLADDLETWSAQIPAFLDAGFRILRYDNRGIGKTSRPPGPYTSDLLAEDLEALLEVLDVGDGFHLLGVSMGGMIAQTYALKYPNRPSNKAISGENADSVNGAGGRYLLSLSLCCTYAQPTPFCSRMFSLWASMAQKTSVQDVMRDVILWAFTVPFFRSRTKELEEVEEAMRGLDMGVQEYLAQLHVIQTFDTTAQLEGLKNEEKILGGFDAREGGQGRVMVLAGKTDILIPVVLSRELAERIEGSRFSTCKGGHGCMWEFPDDFNRVVLGFLNECKVKT